MYASCAHVSSPESLLQVRESPMSAAFITIEDAPNPEDPSQPACDMRLVFSGGFNPRSGAHQAAQGLLKLWDDMMFKMGQPWIDQTVVTPEPMLAIPEGAEATPVASRIVLETN